MQFADHSIIAQLGVPDMRIPIQYALTWPERLPSPVPELDFTALTKLSIATADDETFRCLKACKKAIRKGGLAPCAANGANEAAVAHFLRDEIGFLDIGRLVEGIVDSDSFGGDYTLADVHECDRMARAMWRHISDWNCPVGAAHVRPSAFRQTPACHTRAGRACPAPTALRPILYL